MKNSVLRKRITIVTLVACFLLAIVLSTGPKMIKKSYGYNSDIANIAAYVDYDDNPTSTTFVLENLFKDSKNNLGEFKYTLSTEDGITLDVLDIDTNESILNDNSTFTLGEKGVLIKIDNIVKGYKYNLKIKPNTNKLGYRHSFKEVDIEIDYTDLLVGQISKIVDLEDNEVNIDENDKALFLYTDSNNKIRLRAHEDVDISYYYSLDELTEEQLSSKEFISYDKTNYLSVATNGYLYAKSKYKTNEYSRINSIHINNIDKLDPIIVEDSVVVAPSNDYATITYSIYDADATKEYGKSGIISYYIDMNEAINTNKWIDATNTEGLTEDVYENGTYYVHAKDKAGNTTIKSIIVNGLVDVPEEYVLAILESPYTNLTGMLFTSFDDMQAKFAEVGVTSTDKVLAQVINPIKNQSGTIENVDLKLDLNGYEIQSRKSTPIITVKSTAHLTIVDNKYDLHQYLLSSSARDFDYNNEEYTFVAPGTGTYKLEVWGGQGGSSIGNGSERGRGGYGAYATGVVTLTAGQTLYINTGGKGEDALEATNAKGGYNGGGDASADWYDDESAGGGGGATSIALESGLLSTFENKKDKVLIVAAGGGGSAWYDGGEAGGFESPLNDRAIQQKATQTSGYAFGLGQSASQDKLPTDSDDGVAGAGAGWYGGYTQDDNGYSSGTGGSSYIGNSLLSDKIMYCYNCSNYSDENARTVNTTSHSQEPTKNVAKEGNGFARIAAINIVIPEGTFDYAPYHAGDGDGTITNSNGNAIYVEEGGVLQVGEDNSPDLAHVEYPDHDSPYIYGSTEGINIEGTFNYYDGVIVGAQSIKGEINDTPNLYDPSVVKDTENNLYVMTLEEVTNIEAMIGKTRYTLLETAINVANDRVGTINDQIKIDIVKDLSKSESITIPDNKNIILNLNGHRFTNVVDEPILINNGKTVIMDSGDTGLIISEENKAIVNNTPGELEIRGGSFTSTKWDENVIYNNKDAKLLISSGHIYTDDKYGDLVVNHGGVVNVTGGKHEGNYERSNLILNEDVISDDIDEETIIDNSQIHADTINYNYQFKPNSQGQLEPSDIYGIKDEGCESYYVLDLTNENPSQKYIFEFKTSYKIVGWESVYAYYRTDDQLQDENVYEGRIFHDWYSHEEENTHSIEIYGGEKYYIHFVFIRNSYASEWDPAEEPDKEYVKFYGFKLTKLHTYPGRVNISGGELSDAYRCLRNDSAYDFTTVTGGVIECRRSVETNGILRVSGGNFQAPIFNYDNTYYTDGITVGLYNQHGNVYVSGGTVESLRNEETTDGGDNYEDTRNIKMYVTGGRIGNLRSVNYIDVKDAYIYGTVYYNKNVPDATIDNCTFESSYDDDRGKNIIQNDSPNKLTIKNSSITTSNIYDPWGTDDLTVIANTSTGSIELNNITIDASVNTHHDTYTREEYLALYGIYNKLSGTVDVINTKIDLISEYEGYEAIGVYNESTGTINIGKKDDAYTKDDYYIKTNSNMVFNKQGYINLYDGYLQAKYPMDGTIHEIEDNYYIKRETTNETDTQIYLTTSNIENILNVGTGVKYATLGEALDAAGDSATLRFLNNYNYEPSNYNNTIKSNQTITIDNNGKNIYLGNGLTNNGILTFTDSSGYTAKVYSQHMINNNELHINSSNWMFEFKQAYGILNNGTMTTENTKLESVTLPKNEELFKSLLENNGTFTQGNGTNLYIKNDDTAFNHLILNNHTGIIYLNGGEINQSNLNTDDGKVIYNYGGYVELNNATLNIKSCDGSWVPRTRPIFNISYTDDSDVKHRATFIMNTGIINDSSTEEGYAGSVVAYDTDVTMNDGTINGLGFTILDGSTIHIVKGTFNDTRRALLVNAATAIIDNATIDTSDYGIYADYDTNITINNINITSERIGIHVQGRSYGDNDDNTLIMNGGTIDATTEAFTIGNFKEIRINNVTASASTYGDEAFGMRFFDSYRQEEGKAKIYIGNSKITATSEHRNSYGIYAPYFKGVITLTNNDGNNDGYVSTTTPEIAGDTYGLYKVDAIFNFYDGRLKGETPLYGGVEDRTPEYELYYDTIDGVDCVYLKKLLIAENTDTLVQYSSLQEAFDECSNNTRCNIKLLYPITLRNKITVPATKDIAFNLGTKTIIIMEEKFIENKGKLRISNGTLTTESEMHETSLIENYGELYIETGANLDVGNLLGVRLIYNKPDAKVFVNAGTLKAIGSYWNSHRGLEGKIVYNEGGYVEINGGNIYYNSANYWGGSTELHNISVDVEGTTKTAKLVINNGSIDNVGSGHGIELNDSIFEMHGGTIDGDEAAEIKAINSTLTITDGTIQNTREGLYLEKSTCTIDDITLSNIEKGIEFYTDNTLTINDIHIDNCNTAFEIYNPSNVININKGTINVTAKAFNVGYTNNINIKNTNITVTPDNNNGYGIIISERNANPDITITNSTITVNQPTYNDRNSYGIYVNYGEPTITIGTNDNTVSTTTPSIYGYDYGIYRETGTIKFYDGIFKGTTPMYGGIDDRPTDYTLYSDVHNSINEVYLKKMNVAENTDTSTQYDTLQKAFDSCTDNITCNIKLLYDLISEQTYTVGQNKEIVFDMNNKSINIMRYKPILNNGILTIKKGTIYSEIGHRINEEQHSLIDNKGNLYLDSTSVFDGSKSYETSFIHNHDTGRLFINGATLTNDKNHAGSLKGIYGKIIYNEGGYVEINTGTHITGCSNDSNGWSTEIESHGKTVNGELKKGTIVINAGDFIDKGGYRTFETYDTNITINSASFTGLNKPTFMYLGSGSVLTVNNATFDGAQYAIRLENSRATIVNGIFTNSYEAIRSNNGNILIKDADITNSEQGLDIESTNLTIDNINIDNVIYEGIHIGTGCNVFINDGTIYSNSSRGIYIYGQSSLTLGNNDGVVSRTVPHIKGKEYGLEINEVSGQVSFYDGKITSDGTIVSGVINNLPQDYRIVEIDGNSYILRLKSEIQDTYEYNGIYFQDIDMPINMINNSSTKTGRINIWNNATLSEGITIPEGTDITIALEGHTIDFSDVNTGITNNGTLTIIDGNLDEIDNITESSIRNDNGTVIQNNGTMTLGMDNNPNSQSPKIIGNIGLAGNSPTIKSGFIQSTSNNSILSNIGSFLTNLIQPSYSYVHNELQVLNIGDNVAMSNSPLMRTVKPLTIQEDGNTVINWTNENMEVGLTSHNYGVLNLVSEIDPTTVRNLKYRVEIYKDNELDNNDSFDVRRDVQYLKNTLPVDLDWFIGVETRYSDYILTKMTINDTETNVLPEEVEDQTVFKLFYTKKATPPPPTPPEPDPDPPCEGDECNPPTTTTTTTQPTTEVKGIEIINPKTGRKSYLIPFIIALTISIIIASIYIKRCKDKL